LGYGGVAMTAREQAAIQQAVEALTLLLDSAFPNAKEHPTMYAAWPVGHAALRTLRALGDGWEEISTAPKDGTRMVIYIPGLGEWPAIVDISHWHTPPKARGYWWNFAYLKPTHWQPLPLPPGGKR
jgi:hypothetical protein